MLKLRSYRFFNTEGNTEGNQNKSDDDKNKTFTQDQVNAFLAEERRKQAKQLEDLKKSNSLSAAEKDSLQKQITALQSQFQTKEEQLVDQHKAQLTELTGKVEDLSKKEAFWRTNYAESTFEARTVTAATKKEAFNPSIIATLLRPNMELVEVVDAAGKPTGKFEPRVRLSKKDGDKVTEVLLNPEDAVEHIFKDTAQYGMLFKSTKTGGVGGTNTQAAAGDVADLVKTNPAAYREQYRKQHYGDRK